MDEQRWDVVVVGGGAAGLSGALALARARRDVLVVDAGEPRNGPSDGVHNLLGHDGRPPGEVLAAGRAEVEGYGGRVVRDTAVAARTDACGGFLVELASGAVLRARRLLVTTGVVDELPDVPGLAQRWGRDVLHCPYCHGWEVRDRAVGVLGTGPLAVHQALMWRQWTADVTLLQHDAPAPDPVQAEELAARGVRVVAGAVTGLQVQDDVLTGAVLADGAVVPLEALVVTSRPVAREPLLRGLGLEPEDVVMAGHVVGTRFATTGPAGTTRVPGLSLAGNVAEPMAQVAAAAAAGLMAGAALNADLGLEDTALAVASLRGIAAQRQPFSADEEREVCERVLGDRRHGV